MKIPALKKKKKVKHKKATPNLKKERVNFFD